MPSTTSIPDTSSFLGLQSYTEAQSNSFFGRDAEIDGLTSLIQLNTLTIVFGRSGTGKTSLLNAGVFPRLRKSFCLPFRIRLEFNENSPDLISQIKKVLKEEIDKYGFKVESYPSSETLWEYFHKEPLWKTVTPIIGFDQFEEIFTLAKSNPRFALQELPAFWEELSDVIENNIPEKLKEKFLEQKEKVGYNYKKQKAKVVFSFREEYLPEFESIAAKIPSLKYSRFRLLPMNGNQAYEVITKTWKENITEKEAMHLVSYFTNEQGIKDYSLLTVEPSLLSQVCAYIDKERIESGGGKVSAELLTKYPKYAILRSIYDESVNAANNSISVSNDNKERKNLIKEFIEEKLITTQGYRTKYHLTAHEDILKPGLYVLTTRYLIREDDDVAELTHDVLAPIIKDDREKRRGEMALTKKRKRVLLLILLLSLLAAGFWLVSSIKGAQAVSMYLNAKDSLDITTDSLKVINDSLNFTSGELATNAHILKNVKDSIDYIRKNGKLPCNCDPVEFEKDLKKCDSIKNVKIDSIFLLEQIIIRKTDTIRIYRKRFNIDIDIPQPTDNTGLLKKIKELENQINHCNNDLVRLRQDSADLEKKNFELRLELEKVRKELKRKEIIIDSLTKLLGTASIKGRLYYDKEGGDLIKPSHITMYLIPKANNSKIVKKASMYEINCYDKELEQAKGGFKTITDKNGNYFFRNVPDGKYFLKICTYYGGFYNVEIGQGQPKERNFNASPPVRYPLTNN